MSNAPPERSWRLDKAERFLQAAGRAFEADDWETTVSRAYYAVYHAVIALLEEKTDLRIPRRHPQLHNLLRTPYVSPILTSRDALDVQKLFFARLAANYGNEQFGMSDAQESLARAGAICQRIFQAV